MTRQPFPLKEFLGAKVVKCEGMNFCLPAARLVNPGVIEANSHVSCACGMATILESPQGCTLDVQRDGMKVAIDSRQSPDGKFQLAAGRHLVLALVDGVFGHNKERSLRFMNPKGFRLVNPRDPKSGNPWCFIRFPSSLTPARICFGPTFRARTQNSRASFRAMTRRATPCWRR